MKLVRWSLAAASFAFAVLAAAPTSHAAGARKGDLTIVDIDHGYGPLARGGSATPFSIRPPSTASCPGDSEHDNWMLQTFLVPASIPVESVKWGLNGPLGAHQYPLYDDYSHPVVQVTLRANSGPGQRGQIDEFRPMDFTVLSPGMVPAGTYHLGLACTHFRVLDSYWDTTVVVTTDAHDKPAGFTWRVDGTAPAASSSGGVPWLPVIGVAVALAAAVALVRRLRPSVIRRPSLTPARSEES